MNENKCKLCNLTFFSKQSLQTHENKKRKCNIATEFKCKKCNKFFTQKKNLISHNEKDACKLNITNNNINNDIKNILESNVDISDKVFLIKTFGINLDNNALNKILLLEIPLETKINLLINNYSNNKTPQTVNNTTTNNNTTNNIQFNNFGNENIEYFNENYLKKLINTVSSANKIGAQSVFLKLSNEIYLNENHPENQTIKIDNLNNKFCKIKQNNKWITADKNESLHKIFNRACEIVSMCIMENKDMYKEAQLETINGYIEKDFDDEIIIETVKKLALDIYNFYNTTI
jgi:hypothetical protein